MVRKIVTVKDSQLHQPAKPVAMFDKKLKNLIRDMRETLAAQKDPEGVGLAAPQIGVSLRVFLSRLKGKSKVFINPEILKLSEGSNDPKENSPSADEDYIMEGCLSLPHYYGPVKRSLEVEVKYQNPKGETITETIKGFPAQVIQHEVDHLDGKIFIDRLFEQNRQLYKLIGNKWQEVELP